ncbi:MAG: cytochrome and DOMON domain-containing protein [Spirochaetia bacterium]|nr:cytochrome and DOMON domain-containing protein [Spirochaetia bacterium]
MNTKKYLVVVLMVAMAALVLMPALAEPSVDGLVAAGEYKSSETFEGGTLTVYWTISDSLAWFAMSAPTGGWVALGFGSESMMQGADMAIGWVEGDGTPFVLDCYSTGPYGPHPPDTELGGKDDLSSFAAIEKDGITTIEFSRPIAASEANDKPLVSGEPYIWAYGPTDDFDEYHPVAGYGTLAAPDDSATPAGSAAAGSSAPSAGSPASKPGNVAAILAFVLPHALPLSLSFILMTSGMLVARYGKKNKKWLAIHKPLGAGGAFLGIIGLGFGIRMVAMSTGIHFRVPHAWLGATTLVLAVAAPILGQAMFMVKKNKAGVRKLHRWVGRAAIILMALTIISGLYQSGILG